MGVQLEANHPVESSAKANQPAERSATKKSPYESSATNKLPCREIGYKQINLQRDQLHTNQLVER